MKSLLLARGGTEFWENLLPDESEEVKGQRREKDLTC